METKKSLYRRFILAIKIKIYDWAIRSKDEILQKLDPKPVLNEKQKSMIEVLKAMVSAEDAELLIAPISGTRYVKLGEIYLKIDSTPYEGTFMELINGRFTHHVGFSERIIQEDVLGIFDAETEKRRKIMEKSIWDKTTRSLESVIEEINSMKNSQK
jgi:hypothetical protein